MVDLILGPDVHAAGRLVHQQHLDVAGQPFGQHRFLLVAAGQDAHRPIRARGLQVQSTDEPHGQGALAGAVDPAAEPADRAEVRERDVGGRAERLHQPFALPVLGHEPDPRAQRVPGRVGLEAPPLQPDLPAVERVGPEERPGELGPSGAHQPRNAEHLARVQRKADVVQHPLAAEPARAQHLGPRHRTATLRRLVHRPADHEADEVGTRETAHLAAGHESPIAQDGHPIRDLEHFLESVGDEEHRPALGPQLADDVEELLGLLQREGGRRLVHDDQPGVQRERLGDLNHLPPRDAELGHRRSRVEWALEAVQDSLCLGEKGLPVHQPAQPGERFAPEQNILRHRERGDERRLLINDGDAEPVRLVDGANGDGLAAEPDRARVGLVYPGQDLDQSALARAVLPDEGVDLARSHAERDVLQRLDARKGLGQADDLERGGGSRRRAGAVQQRGARHGRILASPG